MDTHTQDGIQSKHPVRPDIMVLITAADSPGCRTEMAAWTHIRRMVSRANIQCGLILCFFSTSLTYKEGDSMYRKLLIE